MIVAVATGGGTGGGGQLIREGSIYQRYPPKHVKIVPPLLAVVFLIVSN